MKSLPPKFKSGKSAILTGEFTTDSGIYVSNSRNSRKCEFVLISGLFTISYKEKFRNSKTRLI
jgi:hypothetical protein